MFMMPTLIKMWEEAVGAGLPGQSAAKTDEAFYDVSLLGPGERQQAMALLAEQTAGEGSIFILYPDSGFGLYPEQAPDRFEALCAKAGLKGSRRATAVVEDFETFLAGHPQVAIDTVVIPGCGSSPLGAAALGKAVAQILQRPVAAIVAGEGVFDLWMEAGSGGMLMAPLANALNAFDWVLELAMQSNPIARAWAQSYLHDLGEAMHEAATLFALLRRRLTDEQGVLRDRGARGLEMIVSHSKGNWNLLVALLNFELALADRILSQNPTDLPIERRIDVVTLGNPVDLPDQHPLLKRLFHYHQFAGERDLLMALNSSKTLISRILLEGKIHPDRPLDPREDPDERLFVGCKHNLIRGRPDHLPIEAILPAIREGRPLVRA